MDRLKALDETSIDDKLSLQDFTERRLTPAYRTSASVQLRQNSLSNRLGRSIELLRTRMSLKLAQQNFFPFFLRKLHWLFHKKLKFYIKIFIAHLGQEVLYLGQIFLTLKICISNNFT